jgi:hypothetical protein
MQTLVGQAPGLRRPLRPPSAGPRVVFGFGGKAGSHGVVLDVSANSAEFFAVANHVVVTLALPKCLTGSRQQKVRTFSCGGFQGAEELWDAHMGSEQQMNVIGHDDPCVHHVVSDLRAMINGRKYLVSKSRLPEECRAGAGSTKNLVHFDESLARGQVRTRKRAIRRKGIVQTKGDEQWLFQDIQMRESALFEDHISVVDRASANSPRWRPERPPQAMGLPHR